MRYDVGRFRRPMRRSTEGQLMSLISLGDGSTLSLDFTTGQLDPRLTFTRDSNATFINSSGLVQWADSNIFYNSTWTDANNTPTAWSAGSGTASRSGETRTFTTSASQVYITQTRNTSSGIRYTASVEVTAVTGTQRIDDVIVALGGSSYQYYFNGSTAAGSTTLTPGVVGVAFTAGAATTTVRIGSGVQGTNTTGAVTLRFPQFEPGSIASRIYRPNDSTTRSYEAPRFDHDPTTGSPRGLLIEGSANNLFNWSETFDTTGGLTNWNWSALNVTRGTVTTTNPAGASATVIKVEETTTNGLHGPLIVPTGLTALATYTFSVWAKAVERTFVQLWENGGSGANSMVNLSTGAIVSESTAGITTVTAFGSTGWYRISMRLTTIVGQTTANCQLRLSTNGTTTSYAGTTGSGIYIWGAQLEAGSGASSYIPTGASQGSRAADNCYIYDTTTTGGLSWFKTATQGTFYVEMFKRTAGTAFAAAGFGTRATAFQEFMLYQAVGNNWLSFNWGASEYTTNYSALSSPFLIKAAVALSPSTPATEADSTVSINGSNSALNTGPNIALPFTSDLFCIGSRGPASGTAPSQNYAETAIRRIKFFPFAMTAAQMNALTTL